MRSNLLEKVKTPMYFVTLHTQTNEVHGPRSFPPLLHVFNRRTLLRCAQGKSVDVPLTLSLEEMHDLLAKCKDMAKQGASFAADK